MNQVKIIYYDINQVAKNEIDARLSTLGDMCQVGPGIVFVRFNGSAQELYDAIAIERRWIMVVDIDDDTSPYWGFMPTTIWTWLAANRTNSRRV